jgi:hypothetical protein
VTDGRDELTFGLCRRAKVYRVWFVVAEAWFAVMAVAATITGAFGLAVVCGGSAVLYGLFLVVDEPRKADAIRLDNAGIHLLARARTTTIPWESLVSVSSPGYARLRWHTDTARVPSWRGFENESLLFDELQRRAPRLRAMPAPASQ